MLPRSRKGGKILVSVQSLVGMIAESWVLQFHEHVTIGFYIFLIKEGVGAWL